MSEKFKITNTTVKAQRIVDGKDVRSAVEKKGHAVSFRDERNSPIMLQAGQSTIISNLDSGLLGLQRGGFVKIEKIDDIATALQEHAYKPTAQQHNKQVRKAKTAQMGVENYKQKGGSEHEGAVNPDGDPNFLVKATRKAKPRQKRGGVNAPAASRSHKANG
jgi:hypothetical protein